MMKAGCILATQLPQTKLTRKWGYNIQNTHTQTDPVKEFFREQENLAQI
jgi:hypothetical protein